MKQVLTYTPTIFLNELSVPCGLQDSCAQEQLKHGRFR
jgi:hypothetical protein